MKRPIDHEERISILGRTGEKIFSNFMRSQGKNLVESIDNFDSEKDYIVDGKTVEVKTEQPFVSMNSFSFRPNQLMKCRRVDELYFVTVPPLMDPKYRHGGKIFYADPKKFRHREYTTRAGRKMILIPIEQEAVKEVYSMTKVEINELLKYAKSDYV